MSRKIGVVFSYLLMGVEVLSTLFFAPFLLSTLGQAEYGVYKLIASVTSYLFLLDMGVGVSVIRFMSKYRASGQKDEERRFLGITTVYYVIIGVLVLLVGMVLLVIFPTVFAKGLTPQETVLGQKLLGITMVNAAVTLGSSGYFNTLLAYEEFVLSKSCSIAQVIIRVGLDIVALLLGMGSIGVVAVDLLVTTAIRVFIVLYVTKRLKLRPTFKHLEMRFVKEVFAFSSFVFLQAIATQINRMTDQVLLGALVENASVIIAIYAVGIQVVGYFQNIGSSMNNVLLPGVVRLVESGADARKLQDEMVRVGRILFMILSFIWVVFLLNGETFIVLWMGEESREAFPVAAMLMFANIFVVSQAIGTQILWAINKHKTQAILQIISAALNVVLTVILIHWKPLLGATLGTFLSLVIGDLVVMAIVFKKDIGVNMLSYYRELFRRIDLCLLLSLGFGWLAKHLMPVETVSYFIVNCAIMALVYVTSMWLFGMNVQEKQLVRSVFDKVFKILKIKRKV